MLSGNVYMPDVIFSLLHFKTENRIREADLLIFFFFLHAALRISGNKI